MRATLLLLAGLFSTASSCVMPKTPCTLPTGKKTRTPQATHDATAPRQVPVGRRFSDADREDPPDEDTSRATGEDRASCSLRGVRSGTATTVQILHRGENAFHCMCRDASY